MTDRDLPEDLHLPLRSGEPWWYWSGGRPAVDFVNTRRERWRRCVETLVTPDDLATWFVRAGVMDHPERVTPAVLQHARELREAIDALLVTTIEQAPPDAAALALVDEWLAFAGSRPQLVARDGHVHLAERAAADSPRRALGMVALDAAQMLGTAEQRGRIRICASETCSGRFFDRSTPAARQTLSFSRSSPNRPRPILA